MSDNHPSILPGSPPPYPPHTPQAEPPGAQPPAAPPGGKSWPPFMGMLSILTVIFPFLFLCVYCMFAYSMVNQPGFNTEDLSAAEVTNFGLGTIALACGTLIVSLIGIVIGLGALFGKTANKILGIIGLALNGFVLLSMVCGFAWLMI
ncbi:MAG: hypothetical protein JW929_00700 [Anaerolineales bacterium]|nr:hypothetical protein [Anaerolineales bacterium]